MFVPNLLLNSCIKQTNNSQVLKQQHKVIPVKITDSLIITAERLCPNGWLDTEDRRLDTVVVFINVLAEMTSYQDLEVLGCYNHI